jgi:hypothetical protein
MYEISIDEEILHQIIFKLRENNLINLSDQLIDAIDTDYEPDKYVEDSEDYTTDEEEDVSFSVDDEGFHYLN